LPPVFAPSDFVAGAEALPPFVASHSSSSPAVAQND